MEVKLLVLEGKNKGLEIPIVGAEFLIGRGEGCNLRPASDRVSRKHCAILRQEGRVTVIDLNSTNHTFVNGEQITGEHELKNGDRLKVGMLEFEVQLSVSVGGKKKPKVGSIQEAAARTVQKSGIADEDTEIAAWLEDGDKASEKTNPALDALSAKETRTFGDKLSDTSSGPGQRSGDEQKTEEKKKSSQGPGHLKNPKKPTSENTQKVAEDTLRHFLNRKKK
ncbi:MAG: FHA domain-containing protein [Thermoguttaceae bacterium]